MTLVGLRDVRDYVGASGDAERLGTARPFNIKVRSITHPRRGGGALRPAHRRHRAGVLPAAVDRAWHYSRGQPWLVNAIGAQLVDEVVKDRCVAIESAHVDAAKDRLVERQDTHPDSLAERLREPRVRQVIEPILAGSALGDVPRDDLRFLADLGLVRVTDLGGVDVSNPIYRELVGRVPADTPRASLPQIAPSWLRPDGQVAIDARLEAFLAFWRRHGEALQGAAPYRELAAQLVMMAFLDRVANGGGRIERE
jgi:hypothetical protein